MPRSNDFEHITCFNLDKELPGRTIAAFDQEEGEIRFTDGSVLTVTWLEERVGFELFEGPIEEE